MILFIEKTDEFKAKKKIEVLNTISPIFKNIELRLIDHHYRFLEESYTPQKCNLSPLSPLTKNIYNEISSISNHRYILFDTHRPLNTYILEAICLTDKIALHLEKRSSSYFLTERYKPQAIKYIDTIDELINNQINLDILSVNGKVIDENYLYFKKLAKKLNNSPYRFFKDLILKY
jgi:hypothetical protein